MASYLDGRGARGLFGDQTDEVCKTTASVAPDAQNIRSLPDMFQLGARNNTPFKRHAGAAGRVDKHVGAKIRSRRQCLGFSVNETASHCLLPVTLVEKIEQGGSRPTAKTLLELACYLNVPVSFFFEGLSK